MSINNLSEMFKAFLADEEAWDMFIEGPAGTGKTTGLMGLVEHAQQMGLNFIVCAHTHKACGVLRAVLGPDVVIKTLHSFLSKRPTIDQEARDVNKLESSVKTGDADSDTLDIIFIDEFSVVGEKDHMDIRALQDPMYEGDPATKVVWLGDPYQLPPVKDQQSVVPYEPYYCKLIKVYRTDGPLLSTMSKLISMLQGGPLVPLEETAAFHRDVADLASTYDELKWNYENRDVVLLAYTNQAVQDWNRTIQGRSDSEITDKLFSPTLHKEFTLIDKLDKSEITYCNRFGDEPLTLGSKYKTLEYIIKSDVYEFYQVIDEEGDDYIYPVIWGTYAYKLVKERLGRAAVQSNKDIEKFCNAKNATEWSRLNPLHKYSRQRAKAWRDYLTFKDVVQCFDFNHAMTVHKSQGSTFDYILLDSNDLDMCRNKNFNLYLRLFYVAVSRARQEVYCNT